MVITSQLSRLRIFTVVRCSLADDVFVGSFVEIQKNTTIGSNATILSVTGNF
ncbi:hypothetical protein P4S72_06140 [Vibrio sp. PP-XX7]